ncbi:MAG: flagellar protein FlaG [Bryobacterales bacterium]|jgi:flagellar protein FlaG|nr:flagellar protein FlaG [Bryobacterales bacterium]
MERIAVEEVSREQRMASAMVDLKPEAVAVQNSELVQAVRAVNAAELFGGESELTFVIDRRTKMALVRVIDKESGEVVRQFPPEYILALSEELSRLMNGGDSADLSTADPFR